MLYPFPLTLYMFLINVPIWSSEDVFTVLNSIKEMFTFILAFVRQCVKVGEFFPKLYHQILL